MTGTFKQNNGTTTVTFEYEADTTKVQTTVGDAAHYLFDHGYGDHGTEESPIVWADLSNQDKLDIVDKHLVKVIKDAAKTYHIVSAGDTARDTAQEEIENIHM